MADNIIKAEDLLTDEGFLAFCLQKENADNAYWESLMLNNPLQEKEILQAKALLDIIVMKEKSVTDQQQSSAYNRFVRATNQTPAVAVNKRVIPVFLRWSAAAAVIISIGLAFFYFRGDEKQNLQTPFGVVRQEKLPDGTAVTLNANSRVSFANNWNKAENREVWMEGEVFFDVFKTADRKPFIVHSGDLDIEVTGTRFNVHRRSGGTKVFLVEGGITLRSKPGADMVMKPGDYAEFSNGGIVKKAMADSMVTAWIDRKFVFDKTRMAEVARSLEEIYGVSISFSDGLVADKTISGILPNDNLSVLLEALEAAYGFSIVSKDKEIVIGSK